MNLGMESISLKLEKNLISQGYNYIAGIDEAGRGPWAGPVSAGCVIVDSSSQMVEGVNDSKKLNAAKRELLYEKIKENSIGWGIGIVSAEKIDEIGIQEAVLKAMTDALHDAEQMVGSQADYVLADGLGIRLIEEYRMDKIKAGDAQHYSIAAGSILAKVYRDRLMVDYALKYPEYSFDSHMGYGTKAHQEALALHGVTEIHRKTYKPIAKLLDR